MFVYNKMSLSQDGGAAKKTKSNPKKEKKVKKVKKVKKEKETVLTGFFLFKKEQWDSVKKMMPTAAVTALTKKIGEMWRDLTDSEKKKYK